jgi:hypothetical protein
MLDIVLNRKTSHLCNGASRRDFLRIGALAPLGFSLSSMLAMRNASANEKASGGASAKRRAKSVILVYLGGGMSHHDTFDLKPGAGAEIAGKYTEIPSNVKGLHVGNLLPKMAQTMDRLTLVRSQSHNNDHHETATNWVMSGRFGSPFGDYPAMGAVVAHETGFTGNLPPYVAVPRNPSFTWELGRSAFLGGRYESFKAGDPNDANFKVRDLSLQQPMKDDRLARRKNLLQAVDSLASKVKSDDQLATYDEFQQRAAEMILSPQAQAAFDIDKEPKERRDAYGRNTFGQSCLLARRLVEAGVTFVTVNYGGWDHHAKIFDSLDKKLPEFDAGFSSLIKDMDERGSLKDTLVVCMGEFGRGPKVNKDAGRDHWGPAGSMLFAGAGAGRGNVVGATDKTGGYATDRPVSPADAAYTIFDALGINPRKQLHMPDGRPLEILDQGAVVKEIYG